MLRSSTHMVLWLALSLVPLACDNDGGDSTNDDTTAPTDTIAPQDTTADAPADLAPPEDTFEDTPPPPEDTFEDTPPPPEDTLQDTSPPPEDTLEDTPPPPDTIEDIPNDFSPEALDTTPDCDIPPLYPLLMLEDILADPDPLDGAPVAFEGHVILGGMICGDVECPPEDPCCQPCGANYEVFSAGGTIGIVGGGIPQVGCVGNNCTVMENCTPFPTIPADYLLWGTLKSAWGPTLYLDGWCPAQ